MLLRRSRLAARHPDRPFLAPYWLIALLAATVGIALLLLYPREDLARRLADNPDTALSAAYLDNLLRSDPHNPQLRLLLARRQIALGDTLRARQTLQAALDSPDGELRREAGWLLWEIVDSELRRLPRAAAGQRAALVDEYRTRFKQLAAQEWPLERRLELAGKAFALNERELGRRLFTEAAAGLPTTDSLALLDKAASEALAGRDYRGSAELYLLARQISPDRLLARRYYLAAVRTLQAGNQPLAALELGERELGDLADDQEALILLTQLARAAGRPDSAERHVRRLLKLSLLQQWQRHQVARAWGDGVFLPVGQRPPAGVPALPFDDRIYTLGYDVFVENRKLDDAWKVASAAVRQAPDSLTWRRRLAQVAEWTTRPQAALDNWHAIARQSGDDEAWQHVLRLAPGLFDERALIDALRHQVAAHPDDLRLLRELVAAHERLGDPQPALDYLAQRCRRSAQPACLEMQAELAERAGQPILAIAAWQTLLNQPGQLSAPRALRLALLLLTQGRGDDGYRWLNRAQAEAGQPEAGNADYWRLNGQLAEYALDTDAAIRIFRRLVEAGQGEQGDYDALLRLLADDQPEEAALLASLAWQRFGETRHLIQALNLYASRERWTELGRLIGQAQGQPALRQEPDFLRLAAAHYQRSGQLDLARRTLVHGLRLAPESTEMQQALLWLLIDSKDAANLRKLLGRHEMAWRRNPALHDSLAAAYQALSQPQVALARYLKPQLAERRTDFLWMMNYADALEQDQKADQAWRLRRMLLSEEWQTARRNPTAARGWLAAGDLDRVRRLARTRLILTQSRGDPALAALRELLRLDRDSDAKLSDAAAETALGWLQEQGEYNAVRGFLWQQYGRSHSRPDRRPLWAEIGESLANRDQAASGELLVRFDEGLSRYERINIAQTVGDTRLAQSAAFATQEAQTDDDALHMQLAESLLAFSDQGGLDMAKRSLGSIEERVQLATYHLAIDPRLSLDVDWGRIARRVRDNNVFAMTPDEEMASARLRWRQRDGETLFRAERRQSFDDYTPLQVVQRVRIDDRLSLDLGLGSALPSPESVALRVAGMKRQVTLGLNYMPTRVDQIQIEHRRESYRLQNGEALGNGHHTGISYSHALRQETPDLQVGAFWSIHRFDRQTLSDSGQLARFHRDYLPAEQKALYPKVANLPDNYFVPDNFHYYGLRLSTNTRFEQDYTRPWRPFGSVSLTQHSELGNGFDLRLGLAGSVFGADHFVLTGGVAKSGMQSGGLVREMQLTYRIHF